MKSNKLVKQGSLLYESPLMEILSLEDSSVICTSAITEELENGGIVDWFEN